MMHGHEKSDSAIVAVKPTNKALQSATLCSCETDEQSVALCCGAIHSRAIRCGAGGAKGGDQEECGPAKHVRDAGPDKRVTGAGAHTASSKGKEEGEVHLAPPPRQHRSA